MNPDTTGERSARLADLQLDDIHFAMGGAIFGPLTAEHVALTERLGFPGIEPYRSLLHDWLNRPAVLKELLDRHQLSMCTCSNGGEGQSCNFMDPSARQQTIDDHLAFARDFLSVFGCKHFKINMGARRQQGQPTSDDDLRAIALTCDEIGRRTLDLGIRLAPHPHIWGPVERPEEVYRLMELTDPRYVWITIDTGQINLGGGDPVKIVGDLYDRIAAIHFKDTKPEYRGYTGPTPTQAEHQRENRYRDLGAGGVDHEAVYQLLRSRGYRYWITVDLDPPRPSEGEGSPEDKAAINRRYILEKLGVRVL